MKRGCFISGIISLILISSLVICFFQAVDFSTPPTCITEHSLGVNGSIKFMYVNSSLSASAIQILKINKKTKEEFLLKNYEGYDVLVGNTLRRDSLTIFLRQGYWLGHTSSNLVKCDTFHLAIDKVR